MTRCAPSLERTSHLRQPAFKSNGAHHANRHPTVLPTFRYPALRTARLL